VVDLESVAVLGKEKSLDMGFAGVFADVAGGSNGKSNSLNGD